ncbi:nucleoredoxin-like [Lineus longissimus]|uniref:nucleoredoxin-like n=1 Tax=Lineus longissimus TaxID=88925 RepID=UPI00315C5E92
MSIGWCAMINFIPAEAALCPAASSSGGCPLAQAVGKEAEIMLGTTRICELLGDKVQGKEGTMEVASFCGEGKVVALFFSGHWCPPSRTFTPQFIDWFRRFKTNHPDKELEVVFISSDRSQAEFDDYYKDMPWLALPYADRETKNKISKTYGVTGIPTVVLLCGCSGEVITKDGRSIVSDDPSGAEYPWKPKPFGEIIYMGNGKLIDNKGTNYDPDFALKNKYVGVFFSGHWCPPSQAFTPKLIETYKAIQRARENFEIVFASSDRSEGEFTDYFKDMPWLALPYGDERKKKLNSLYGVTGIPTLIILDEKGEIVTKNGRGAVTGDPEGKEFPWLPKPLNKLVTSSASSLNEKPSCVFFVEKQSEAATAVDLLEEVAKDYHKSDPEMLFFFSVATDDDGIGERLTKYLGIDTDEEELPFLMICDVQTKKYTRAKKSQLTKEGVGQFVKDYLAKK